MIGRGKPCLPGGSHQGKLLSLRLLGSGEGFLRWVAAPQEGLSAIGW